MQDARPEPGDLSAETAEVGTAFVLLFVCVCACMCVCVCACILACVHARVSTSVMHVLSNLTLILIGVNRVS